MNRRLGDRRGAANEGGPSNAAVVYNPRLSGIFQWLGGLVTASSFTGNHLGAFPV